MEEAIEFLSDAAGSSPGAGFAVDWTSVGGEPAERQTAERAALLARASLPGQVLLSDQAALAIRQGRSAKVDSRTVADTVWLT